MLLLFLVCLFGGIIQTHFESSTNIFFYTFSNVTPFKRHQSTMLLICINIFFVLRFSLSHIPKFVSCIRSTYSFFYFISIFLSFRKCFIRSYYWFTLSLRFLFSILFSLFLYRFTRRKAEERRERMRMKRDTKRWKEKGSDRIIKKVVLKNMAFMGFRCVCVCFIFRGHGRRHATRCRRPRCRERLTKGNTSHFCLQFIYPTRYLNVKLKRYYDFQCKLKSKSI